MGEPPRCLRCCFLMRSSRYPHRRRQCSGRFPARCNAAREAEHRQGTRLRLLTCVKQSPLTRQQNMPLERRRAKNTAYYSRANMSSRSKTETPNFCIARPLRHNDPVAGTKCQILITSSTKCSRFESPYATLKLIEHFIWQESTIIDRFFLTVCCPAVRSASTRRVL
jgi:hypothetical protein